METIMSISEINIGQLLKPISKEKPIGEELSIFDLKNMALGTPKNQWSIYVPPNWRNVYRTSQKYLRQGKDLWAVHYLTCSAMELYEFDGLIKGLDLLKQMLEKYWDDIPPLLEPDEDEEFCIARLSPIATLCAKSEFLYKKIMTMPLVKTKRLGTFSFEELKTLAEEYGVRKKEHEKIELNHIYSEIQGEYLNTLLAYFKKCLELWTGINDFVNDKVGIENNTSRVKLMIDLFNELTTFFKENLTLNPDQIKDAEDIEETKNSEADSKEKTTTTKKARRGQLITSRKDIEKVFNEVCRWLEEHEPSSPVLVLTENARDLIGKKYIETSGEISSLFTKLNRTIRLFDGPTGSSSSSEPQQPTGTNSKDDDSQGIKPGDGMPNIQVRQGQKGTVDSGFLS